MSKGLEVRGSACYKNWEYRRRINECFILNVKLMKDTYFGSHEAHKHKPAMLSDAQLKIKPPFPILEETCFGLFSLRSSRSGYCSVQFSSVAQSCPTLRDPMNRSTPGLPVHHQLPEFTQAHVHRVSDAIQPLSSPSPPALNPSQHQSFPMSQLFA